jgi:hypothetical protein
MEMMVEINKSITLKRSVKSKKFDVTFPNNTPLSFFKSEGNIFAEHPKHKNLYIRVSDKNIKDLTN